jgi:hypothetical protein
MAKTNKHTAKRAATIIFAYSEFGQLATYVTFFGALAAGGRTFKSCRPENKS